MLELLDERIVPSGVGMAAAVAEHAAIHAANQVMNVHAVVHPNSVHDARVHHHHHRIVPAAQVSRGSSSTVVIGTPSRVTAASPTAAANPAPVGSTTGPGQAKVPTVATSPNATSVTPAPTVNNTSFLSEPATTTDPGNIQNGPLAKAGQDLITLYEDFQKQGGSATFTSSEQGVVRIVGTSVGVDVHSAGGNFGSLVSAMTALGMQVQAKDATHGIIEGLLPIGQLVSAAQNSQTLSLSPVYIPHTF